jgi:hypothetical protein
VTDLVSNNHIDHATAKKMLQDEKIIA